jgi:hypothetical protein
VGLSIVRSGRPTRSHLLQAVLLIIILAADIRQGRDVEEAMFSRREQRGRDNRQRRVLGPADDYFPLQGDAPFNDDFVHFKVE